MVKKQTTTNLTCFDIADYFLSLTDEEAGDSISNLKLQKLVYYAQGFSLALHGKPLFSEAIEAWAHGPVVPELYQKYKSYGCRGIEKPKDIDFDKYSNEVKDLLNDVWNVYGQYSAWRLRALAHEEPPWQVAYNSGTSVISHKELTEYFKTQIEE